MNEARTLVAAQFEPIPLVDLSAQHVRHRAELSAAVERILSNSSFIGGREHEAFASEFAEFCGGGHVTLVGNGTDALTLAILEVLGQGDGRGEIITTSHTFVATAEAIVHAGYRPVFADIDAGSGLVAPAAVKRAITPATARQTPQNSGYDHGQCSSGTCSKFIPYTPARNDSGMKIVEIMVRIFIDSLSRLLITVM